MIRGLQDITVDWLIGVAFSVWGLTHVWFFVRTRSIPVWRDFLQFKIAQRRARHAIVEASHQTLAGPVPSSG